MIDIAATAPAQRRWRQHPNLLFFMEQTPDDLLQWEMWISQFLVLQRFREDMHMLPFRMVEPDVQSFARSEEHTSELQSLMRISYAVFCLKTKKKIDNTIINNK